MKNKKWLLVLIVAFPSFFWLILETSTINSSRLPHYGPKTVIAKGDTSFYKVSDEFYADRSVADSSLQKSKVDTTQFPLYVLMFVNENYRTDSYRLTGLWEYLNYKREKIVHLPIVLVTATEDHKSLVQEELKKFQQYNNVHFYSWPKQSFDSINKTYFKEKPYYIDYSFFVLVDKKRNIRGYYDGRYVSELKRLIEEYKHLRLKEEKQKLIEDNEIKSDS